MQKDFKINLLPVSTSVLLFRINLAPFLPWDRALMKPPQTSGGVSAIMVLYDFLISLEKSFEACYVVLPELFHCEFLKNSKLLLHQSNCPFFYQHLFQNFLHFDFICVLSAKTEEGKMTYFFSQTHTHTQFIHICVYDCVCIYIYIHTHIILLKKS